MLDAGDRAQCVHPPRRSWWTRRRSVVTEVGALPARALTTASLAFQELLTNGDEVWWVELRPDEGRAVLASQNGRVDGEVEGGVGSRVHEYGGAAALVVDGTSYWVDR